MHFVMIFIVTPLVSGCVNNGPLGMISGDIDDWQITASSSYPNEWDSGCDIPYARPYISGQRGWCARFKTTSEWLQIDMGVTATVTGVMTQGRGDGREWVSQYLISYSPDGEMWNYVLDSTNIARVFEGNSDSYTVQHNYLPEPVHARFVKIQIYSWNKHPSMRVELIGCQDRKQQLGRPPYGVLRASSAHRYKGGSSCQAESGHILSDKAWCPVQSAEGGEWLELDIGPPALVTTLVTKGRGDTGRKQWVTRYRVAYSNNSRSWTYYGGDGVNHQQYLGAQITSNQTDAYAHLPNRVSSDGVMEFGGNVDKNTARIQYLAQPFTARYVRFYPTEWHRTAALRIGLLGKPYEGECVPGFTRPNPQSPCVENIAFGKDTWLNKERHQKRALEGVVDPTLSEKLSQKAVDGLTANNINQCTIVDNYYDDEPQLTIDLGRRYNVAGIVVYTWLGQMDESDRYNKDYAISIESLSVYISTGKGREELCGKISNTNNELILKREQSLACSRRITGRYIRIQPDGRAERWQKWYSAVICEVTAFT